DNIYVEKKNSGRYLIQYNYTMSSSDGVAAEMWIAAYRGIMEANRVIDAEVTGANVAAIKAEAYAIRALLYFKLINIFAKPYTDDPSALGVPLVLHYDPYNLPSRNKVSEVYQQIVSDLKAAFQNGPGYVNSTRFSKYAIEALLAKVYLYMGDNANAKTAAVDVINNSAFTLLPASDYNNYWADPGNRDDQLETMLEIDADVINNNGFDDFAGMYLNGYDDMYASQQLYNLYSATDVRISVIESGFTKSGSAAFVVTKFPNAGNSDRDNIKVMRLSEVYLIAAEASLPGNETDAKYYLNALVAERDPAFPGYTSTGATLLNDIITERRKELAFEGDRFYDLNRLKMQIVRASNAGAIPAPLTIAYPADKRLAPIPLTEIQANPNIAGQQNPGY
ncbi:MAG TPA: RagB/SusD family nutrient uptake outer membrane protein, partial [Chitinophagaceae bacterium]|nr:RagB/SusD family nutrient uptake outer membrane protein [Chitinophagaceae bacterium]